MIDIDALKRDKRPQSAWVVHALIDRLEAAESEAIEQARLNGMGSEREAALMAKLEVAEKTNRGWLRANATGGWIDNLRIENDTLRAKIDQLEEDTKAVILAANSGAQSETSVPDDWMQHAARMAALARKLREPDLHFESIREMQRELCALEEAAFAAAPEAKT